LTINRRVAIGRVLLSLQAASLGVAHAQGGRIAHPALPGIGFLSPFSRSDSERTRTAFASGMQERGLASGKDYAIHERYADGNLARLDALAQELAALKVSQIVAVTTPAADAAHRAAAATPIVFVGVTDDEIPEFADSLSRPGRNVTGLGMYALADKIQVPTRGIRPTARPDATPPRFQGDLNPKRLELLKRTLPRLTRVVLLVVPSPREGPGTLLLDQSAQGLSLQIGRAAVTAAEQIDAAIDPIAADGTAAVLVSSSATHYALRARIAERTLARRVPSMFAYAEGPDAGGLMSYGSDMMEMCRGAAAYADKILRGAKPADLPIELPRKLDLVLNLRTAAMLGLAIPTSIALQATRTIE
jgi:putative ABC transport system substrate-binding protein